MTVMDAVAFWDAKLGTETSEWEDGVAYDRVTGWFAVADGASTGAGSREWAHALTSSFVQARRTDVFAPGEIGEEAYRTWLEELRVRFVELAAAGAPAKVPSWVREAGRREGAYATMLGGWFDRGVLRMVAVGDCCAFVVSGSSVVDTFPIGDPSGFDNAPDLISSLPGAPTQRGRAEVRLGSTDELVVATDAFAEYLLRHRGDQKVWQLAMSVAAPGFRDLLNDLRTDRQVKNDDVTMLRCRPFGIAHSEGGSR